VFNFIIPVEKFGGGSSPPKNWWPKRAKLWSTSDDFKLRPRIYRKSKRYVIDSDSSRVWRRKSGELWSINNKVGHVRLDSSKSTSSEDHISATRGCWGLEFLHALEDHQGLPAHTPSGMAVHQFFLKINIQQLD